ncbi:TetR/AcrR family transcriptional regulator [Nonomuraea maritima]|uniref:TetR/AcrR family transcriptional regulator n=1 Tax=Nonomuraea maritima TaxID=683260 RepID=UPI003716C990
MMAGLREKKKEQTRRRISEAALRLFDERGYDAVTIAEVAEAAGVAKVTLLAYFSCKDSLVLDAVKEDLAAIVVGREEGRSPLDALREHYRRMASNGTGDMDVEELFTRIRVISSSPALLAGLQHAHASQRAELAAALASALPGDGLVAQLMAAQISAAVTTLQEAFFHRLSTGVSLEEAGRLLGADVDLAFDLLQHGFSSLQGEKS